MKKRIQCLKTEEQRKLNSQLAESRVQFFAAPQFLNNIWGEDMTAAAMAGVAPSLASAIAIELIMLSMGNTFTHANPIQMNI